MKSSDYSPRYGGGYFVVGFPENSALEIVTINLWRNPVEESTGPLHTDFQIRINPPGIMGDASETFKSLNATFRKLLLVGRLLETGDGNRAELTCPRAMY